MDTQNLIIYKFKNLYQILRELEPNLNFKIIEIFNEKSLEYEIKNIKNYVIISPKQITSIKNQLILQNLPMKMSKLIEKLNVEFLKIHFNQQSKIHIKDYIIDLNSRVMFLDGKKLKLTEKEVNTIIYLFDSNKSVSINELQINVWQYQSDIETHTVETHIYRLRKKIINIFGDANFIINDKNGYKIK